MSHQFDALQARKELLLMKIQLERMELGEHVHSFKEEFAWVGVFKRFTGWVGRRNLDFLGPLAGVGEQFDLSSLRKHPFLALLLSTALWRFKRPVRQVVRAGFGAVLLGVGLFWFQHRDQKVRSSLTEKPAGSFTNPSGP